MTKLTFEMDTPVLYKNKLYLVKSPINLTQLLLVDVESGDVLAANICDLKTNSLTPSISSSEQSKFLTISNLEWDEAKRREAILEPLSKLSMCPVAMANEAAHKLNLSVRQIYTLINRYRNSDFQLLSLLPYQPTGGKNKGRIATELEEIIQKVIKECYLTKQKLKVSVIVEEIRRQCYHKNIKPPAAGTIRARVNTIKSEEKVRLRESTQQSKYQYHSFEGTFPTPDHPLDVIQIDHTPVDIIIVDDFHRKPIGRPYLTIAIDVYSRCIAGFILTLEAPSSVSVGLCLTHAILDKQEGLLKQNLEHSNWPIWGKPNTLYVDNAKEFHSKALERGCEVHGIKINYRPIGEPHYGGIVERVIGTFMQLTHQLPGTTFSNIFEKSVLRF